MFSPTSRRRGYALLSTLIMVSFLVMLGGAVIAMATTSARVTNQRVYGKAALALAQGVLDQAVAELTNDDAYTGFNGLTFAGGTVSATITDEGSGQKSVTATASVATRTGSITRRVKAYLNTGPVAPIFYRAIAAKTSFTVGGAIDIDSYPTPHVGDVHCNADVTHNGGGSGAIDGKSTASGTVTLHGSPSITGGTTSGVAPITFPEISMDLKDMALANGITTGNVTKSDGSTLQGKINGNLTISGTSGATVNGVVWVTGTVTISGPVSGIGTILSDSTIELNSRTYDERTDPSAVAYLTTSTSSSAITLKGNRNFKGILYAPNGRINFQGNTEFYGLAMANEVAFGGNPSITRWTDFDSNPPPLPTAPAFGGYQEL